ncbi:MAG: hypothetical protein ABJX32_01155 [Tateyamaria sp.]|uniref:hypothetical protein n=1 Tax=Tateyamaria sp. TaxID=1929288 RepID=UPI00329EA89D
MKIPGLIDVQRVRDPGVVRSVAADTRLGRVAPGRGPLVNRFIARMAADLFRAEGRVLPSGRAPDDRLRLDMRAALAERIAAPDLSDRCAAAVSEAAAFVRGGSGDAMRVTQAVLGSVVLDAFEPSTQTVKAAEDIGRGLNGGLLRQALDWIVGGSRGARSILFKACDGDLNAVHTLGIASQNFAASLSILRSLPPETEAEVALARAMTAPAQVVRQGKCPAETRAGGVDSGTLVILQTSDVTRRTLDPRDAFLRDAWSGCPAHALVPDLLRRIWIEAGGAP